MSCHVRWGVERAYEDISCRSGKYVKVGECGLLCPCAHVVHEMHLCSSRGRKLHAIETVQYMAGGIDVFNTRPSSINTGRITFKELFIGYAAPMVMIPVLVDLFWS